MTGSCCWHLLLTGFDSLQLALKHRQNKHHRTKIVVFIASPIAAESKDLERLAKRLKKEKVHVDVILFGEHVCFFPWLVKLYFLFDSILDCHHTHSSSPAYTVLPYGLTNKFHWPRMRMLTSWVCSSMFSMARKTKTQRQSKLLQIPHSMFVFLSVCLCGGDGGVGIITTMYCVKNGLQWGGVSEWSAVQLMHPSLPWNHTRH